MALTFPAGGPYTLFADFKPAGGGHLTERIPLQVAGKPAPPAVFSGTRGKAVAGGYEVSLEPAGGRYLAGAPARGTVIKTGIGGDMETGEHAGHGSGAGDRAGIDGLALRATVHCLAGCSIGEVLGEVPGAMDAPLGSALFWGPMAASLALAGLAAFPLNRWLIRRGKGHAVIHAYHAGHEPPEKEEMPHGHH